MWTRGLLAQSVPAEPIRWDQICAEARSAASRPYVEPADDLPDPLKQLNYDTYRLIQYRRERQLWRGTAQPFRIEFYHRGYLFAQRVELWQVEPGRPQAVPFTADLFDYHGHLDARQLPSDLGFAGFRVLYPLNRPDKHDELISFLGGSYFRALGEGHVYGASARGLAINTEPVGHEEFPAFTRFWIEHPGEGAAHITILALMESLSITGAFRFEVHPGKRTAVDVRARLFSRRDIRLLGVAPVTSMFLFDESTIRRSGDSRPEVHDSDGLLVAGSEGQRIWRPLCNPPRPAVSRYALEGIRGFGLLQRDRRFEHYQDREAHYHHRPSIWIEPRGNWGAGCVELIELPSDQEGFDNITAFWVSAARMSAGEEREFEYRLWVCDGPPPARDLAGVRRTRWTSRHDGAVDFQIEFAPAAGTAPEYKVLASRGTVTGRHLHPHPRAGSWQLSFRIHPEGSSPIELTACLCRGQETISETWSYQWDPSK